jgi:hypothetical protein
LVKSIETLVPDIYSLFEGDVRLDKGLVQEFGYTLGNKIASRMSEVRGKPTLRLSNLGTPCDRKLWYSINAPQLAEPLSAPTRIKFLFGDILEELVLFLAKAAGHTVTDEQKEVEVDGVVGHIDAMVDGELVDVKSASPYSFTKFKDGLKPEDDGFGYLTQLGLYGHAVGGKRAHFLPINKVLGHIHLDTHEQPNVNYAELVQHKRDVLAANTPPPRGYEDVPDGLSGNRKLGVGCSYCAFKDTCWPGLRTFAYARGPVYLTTVVREPRVSSL